jgi:hypothetical protein
MSKKVKRIQKDKKVHFTFFRHGYSCSNFLKNKDPLSYYTNMKNYKYRDAHLVNWGILGSILSGKYVRENILQNTTYQKVFVSPLLRTWETLTCMFPDITEFEVGPYLREGIPRSKKIVSRIVTNLTDVPYSLQTNIQRYNNFVTYVQNNALFTTIQKQYPRVENSIQKQSYKKYTGFTISNTSTKEKQHTMIQKNSNDTYQNDKFDKKGDIMKFIQDCKNKVSHDDNVLVICHGTLILADFVKTYAPRSFYKTYKHIKHNNNYGFSIDITYHTNNTLTIDFSILYKGFSTPSPNSIENMSLECSICFTDFTKYNCKKDEQNYYNNMTSHIQEN